MVLSAIRLYEIFKSSIGEKEAEALIHTIDEKMNDKFEQKKNELASKDDVSALRAELLRTIYLTSLGQLVAIIASVVSLILVLKK